MARGNRLRDEPPFYLALGVLGILAAAAITFGDMLVSEWNQDARDFVGASESILWLALVFAQFALWLGLQWPLWRLASTVSGGERWGTSVFGLVAVVSLIALVV